MDADNLREKFHRLGARAKVRHAIVDRFRVDIAHDRAGEYFDLVINPIRNPLVRVLDVQDKQRHLLLMVANREDDPMRNAGPNKAKFLCGHDERHWFVAAVPEKSGASNVETAMQALKPETVRRVEAEVGLRRRCRHRRRNRAFVRQGEWFFIPQPDMAVDEKLIQFREPLSRGIGSKPHIAEFCFATGGELVYVSQRYPTGLTQDKYKHWLKQHPGSRMSWTPRRRNAGVYVRGKVRHPDHKTIVLRDWHRVEMNTEHEAKAMRHVAFID